MSRTQRRGAARFIALSVVLGVASLCLAATPALAAPPAQARTAPPVPFTLVNDTFETVRLLGVNGAANEFVQQPPTGLTPKSDRTLAMVSNGVPTRDHANLRFGYSGGVNYEGLELWVTLDPTPAEPGRSATCTVRRNGAIVADGRTIPDDPTLPWCDYLDGRIYIAQPDRVIIPVIGAQPLVVEGNNVSTSAEDAAGQRTLLLEGHTGWADVLMVLPDRPPATVRVTAEGSAITCTPVTSPGVPPDVACSVDRNRILVRAL